MLGSETLIEMIKTVIYVHHEKPLQRITEYLNVHWVLCHQGEHVDCRQVTYVKGAVTIHTVIHEKFSFEQHI